MNSPALSLRVNSKSLLTELKRISPAVPRKHPMPVIMHFLLRAADRAAQLSSTDLEISMHTSLPCEVLQPGETLLPLAVPELLKRLPDCMVTLTADADNRLTVAAPSPTVPGREDVYSFSPEPVANYPKLSRCPDDAAKTGFAASDFCRALECVSPFVSRDELRPVLEGISIRFKPETIECAATDGHRLARYRFHHTGASAFSTILPFSAAKALLKSLKGKGIPEGMTMTVEDNGDNTLVEFRVGGLVLASKIIAGRYPDYDTVLPRGFHWGASRSSRKTSLPLSQPLTSAQMAFRIRSFSVSTASARPKPTTSKPAPPRGSRSPASGSPRPSKTASASASTRATFATASHNSKPRPAR